VIEKGSRIDGIGEDRTAERVHLPHLVGGTNIGTRHIGTRAAERSEVRDLALQRLTACSIAWLMTMPCSGRGAGSGA
jgi:hypothetical protein